MTYIIAFLILGYSVWVFYRSMKSKLKGDCDTACSGCSLNGSCSVNNIKADDDNEKIHLKI